MTKRELSIKSYQLSLSDHYWIKPTDSSITWDEVNFFSNPFIDTPVFITEQEHIDANLITPNSSINGSLRQMWIKEQDDTILLKAGKTLLLEPVNEVFISQLLNATPINHVRYDLRQLDTSIKSTKTSHPTPMKHNHLQRHTINKSNMFNPTSLT